MVILDAVIHVSRFDGADAQPSKADFIVERLCVRLHAIVRGVRIERAAAESAARVAEVSDIGESGAFSRKLARNSESMRGYCWPMMFELAGFESWRPMGVSISARHRPEKSAAAAVTSVSSPTVGVRSVLVVVFIGISRRYWLLVSFELVPRRNPEQNRAVRVDRGRNFARDGSQVTHAPEVTHGAIPAQPDLSE